MKHDSNLDVVRAFAVVAVFFHHASAYTGFNVPLLGHFSGLLGVQLFFILSGYLICASAETHSLKDYTLHRILRIYPAYLLATFVVGILDGTLRNTGRIADEFPYFLAMLLNFQQFSPKALGGWDVLRVNWTLTVEVCWYLTAPFVVLGMRRTGWLLLILASMASTLWVVITTDRAPIPQGHWTLTIINLFPAQLVFFVIGATIYRYRVFLPRLDNSLLLLVGVLTLLSIPYWHFQLPTPIALSGIGLGAFFVLALKAPAWNDRLLIRIGKVSYSIYLLHVPVLLFVSSYLSLNSGLAVLVSSLLVFLVANAMYEFVERPAVRFARQVSSTGVFAKKTLVNVPSPHERLP